MDLSRRRFFGGRRSEPPPFRPPWSLSEAQFADRCSRCDECVRACPTGLLVRSEGGFPVADFSHAACTFCAECVAVCKPGALSRSADQPPWQFVIAIERSCLPLQGVECRVCGEACEVGAIRVLPRLGGAALPEVDSALCSGCGACLAPCPVTAIRRVPAIIPNPNPGFSPVAEPS